MPIHDWTRVPAGTFHAFHNAWITHLQEALNSGILPRPYYALGEQSAGDISTDLLTLHVDSAELAEPDVQIAPGGQKTLLAVAESPPKVQVAQEAKSDLAFYLGRRRTLTIRHVSGDRIVAVIEILSPANKHGQTTIERFVEKILGSLRNGVHVLVVDLLPPTRADPNGIHGTIWDRLMAGEYEIQAGQILTLVSYCAAKPIRAYVEPCQVGSRLTDMPLFLTPEHYVPVPLETTYMQAWEGVPERWRRVIPESSG